MIKVTYNYSFILIVANNNEDLDGLDEMNDQLNLESEPQIPVVQDSKKIKRKLSATKQAEKGKLSISIYGNMFDDIILK